MNIIGAAALIAVGIVAAAVIYAVVSGRMEHAKAGAPRPEGKRPEATNSDLAERTAAVARREDTLAQREAQLEQERAALSEGRQELAESRRELARELERVSGLSAARAKQMLLKEVED